jgi:hypothetical protein
VSEPVVVTSNTPPLTVRGGRVAAPVSASVVCPPLASSCEPLAITRAEPGSVRVPPPKASPVFAASW